MDLLYIVLIYIIAHIPNTEAQGTCAAGTQLTTQTVSLFTSNPTVSIGGAASSTLNLGVISAPVGTNTVKIGDTGSTITIGSVSSPTSYSNVLVGGVSPTSWSYFSGVAPGPASATTSPTCLSMNLPVTNFNSRSGTPSPAPTTNAYLASCNTVSPAISAPPTVSFAGTSDCIVFPQAGYWSITGSFSMQYNTQAPTSALIAYMSLLPANTNSPTAVDIHTVYSLYTPTSNPTSTTYSTLKIVTIPTSSPTPTPTNTYYYCYGCSAGTVKPDTAKLQGILIRYLGPI